jgi:hypothetical protein
MLLEPDHRKTLSIMNHGVAKESRVEWCCNKMLTC